MQFRLGGLVIGTLTQSYISKKMKYQLASASTNSNLAN